MEVFSPRVALHPVGPLGWPFLAQTSPSEPATAEDERRAERRAGAPARSHRPTSTTLARRRVELAGPAGSPYAAIDTTWTRVRICAETYGFASQKTRGG